MNNCDNDMNQDIDNLVKSIKPMIEEFLSFLDENGFELNEEGDVVPKKGPQLSLNRSDLNE